MKSIELIKAYDHLTKYKFNFTQLSDLKHCKNKFFKSIWLNLKSSDLNFCVRCVGLSCPDCIFRDDEKWCMVRDGRSTVKESKIINCIATILGINNLYDEFTKWQELKSR